MNEMSNLHIDPRDQMLTIMMTEAWYSKGNFASKLMHPVDAAVHLYYSVKGSKSNTFPHWAFTNAENRDIMSAAKQCACNIMCLWQIAATMVEDEWSVAALVAGYKEALRN